MMAGKKANVRKKIIEATLDLAAQQSWNDLTHKSIAAAAKVPLAIVIRHFASNEDILTGIIRHFDDLVSQSIGQMDYNDSLHNRLFEVMMARFDVLQHYRLAILNIMAAARRTPTLARIILMAQWHSMSKMLGLSGISEQQPWTVGGLLSLYGLVLYSWRRDETADMAKTMAALDRYLRITGMFAQQLCHRKI